MGKIINLTGRTAPVRWTIEVGDCEDYVRCHYIDESVRGAHWKVFIMAPTVDRVQELIEEAKLQLNRCIAANVVHSECVPIGHRTKAAKSAAGRRAAE